MTTVFIIDSSVSKAKPRNNGIARGGGANRNPKSEKKIPATPPSPSDKGKTKANPPAVPPKEGKADSINRNPKDV